MEAYFHLHEMDGPDDNMLSRVRNALVRGINEVLLPKAILIIFDDDLMDAIDHYKSGISYALGKTLEWLANEFHKIINTHKEKLPTKARKFKYPAIIWFKIPYHEVYGHYNGFKTKYNDTLDKICQLYREMFAIKMDKHTWNRTDLSYFQEGQISHVGLTTYWQSICNAFEYWDRKQMKSILDAKHAGTPLRKGTNSNGDNSNERIYKNFHRERLSTKSTFRTQDDF